MDFDGRVPGIYASRMNFGFYAVYLKDVQCGDIKYGRHTYDYQDRTLVFVAPGQIINVNINKDYKPQGYALLFHPDLIRELLLESILIIILSSLIKRGKHYTYLKRKEELCWIVFQKLNMSWSMLQINIAEHWLASNIELFLNYCMRFYDRQFITRNEVK